MTLADERTKELDDPTLGAGERALLRCRLAADLVQRGRHQDACEALGGLWRGIGERPNLEGLGGRAAAEALLQAGALSGWLGASRQVAGAQGAAKDLISEAAGLFGRLGLREREALALSEMALCYWREGAFDEARVLLTRASDDAAGADAELRATVLLRLVTVECAAGKLHDALDALKESARLLDESDNHALRGSFHSLHAVTLRRLGALEGRDDYYDKAIIEHSAAIYHYEQARHDRYCASNENNLANLLGRLGHYAEAHEHLDRGRAVCARLNDPGVVAQFDETRARVLAAEGRYAEAEGVIAGAVETLEKGGAGALLAEALTTQGVVLARLGDSENSVGALRRAVCVAEQAGARCAAGRAALTLVEEHGASSAIDAEEAYDLYLRADSLLEETQDAEDVSRLRECARVVMGRLAGAQVGEENFTLFGAVHEVEARLITRALEEADGSVTHAARLLGLRHQTLAAMLQTRHSSLMSKRTPPQKRLRSIIKVTRGRPDGRA